jgi:hypothetical protein
LNKEVLRAMGFSREVELVETGHCPFCGIFVIETDFRDEESRLEFEISGLCQTCQDTVFGKE